MYSLAINGQEKTALDWPASRAVCETELEQVCKTAAEK
jgi:hypothetical protein